MSEPVRANETQTRAPARAQLEEAARALEPQGPEATLRWMVERFHPRLYVACSFQKEASVVLDMLLRIEPEARFFYLDTDLLFPETYETRDRLAKRYGVAFERYHNISLSDQAWRYGPDLWGRDPDLCCELRKTVPLRRALSRVDGWISGLRRQQGPGRAGIGKVLWDERFGLVKANPLADWTEDQVWDYLREHDVPYNPLHERGYPSIGCTHCTRPVAPGEDERAGRWAGFEKTECGLHEPAAD